MAFVAMNSRGLVFTVRENSNVADLNIFFGYLSAKYRADVVNRLQFHKVVKWHVSRECLFVQHQS